MMMIGRHLHLRSDPRQALGRSGGGAAKKLLFRRGVEWFRSWLVLFVAIAIREGEGEGEGEED